MHKLFNKDNPKMCSRRTYARRVKSKNISFCKLGEEDCAVCKAIRTCSATPSVSSSLRDNETEKLATELAKGAMEEQVLHKESLPGDNWKKSVKERI